MGAWGPAIMSNDLAADLQADFKDYVAAGKSPQETRQILAQEYEINTDAENEDAHEFWIVLSQIEWKLGRLEDDVKQKALDIIESGANIEDWKNLGAQPADIKKRALALEKLKATLLSQQPAAKPLKPRPENITPYNVGDIFYYQHNNGKYYLFLVYKKGSDKGGTYAYVVQLNTTFEDRDKMMRAKLKWLSPRKGVRSLMIVDWHSKQYKQLVKSGRIGLVGEGNARKAIKAAPKYPTVTLFQCFEPGGKIYFDDLFDF